MIFELIEIISSIQSEVRTNKLDNIFYQYFIFLAFQSVRVQNPLKLFQLPAHIVISAGLDPVLDEL